MILSATYHFEGCNLRILGSLEIVLLSGCWKLDRVRMAHREDGKVDLLLTCDREHCLCAEALKNRKACAAPSPCEGLPLGFIEHPAISGTAT